MSVEISIFAKILCDNNNRLAKVYKISIIIPVYNVRKYVGRCINSIFAQDCSNAEIECLLVDDCTKDDSMDIVAQKLQGYEGKIHFVILSRPVNGGLCATRNTGIRASKGDYLLFVDSDDYLQPGTVQYFIEELEKAGGDVDVVMGNTFSCMDKRAVMNLGETVTLIDNTNKEGLQKLMSREIFHTSWNKMVKKKFFIEDKIFFEDGIINEDLLWSYLLFLRAKNILLLPRVTYIYEDDNPDSITNTSEMRIPKILSSRVIICNKILASPPPMVTEEYYTYVFFILMKALNLFEKDRKELYIYKNDLYSIRNQLLRDVWHRGFYALYLFLLTSVKPFYYVISFRFFRRNFDTIMRMFVAIGKKTHL